MKPTKKILNKLSKLPWFPICLIGLVIIFFSIRLVITYDSTHYLGYVDIFEGNLPASSWDIVRGPIFPAIIFLFDTIFGKTGTGILVGTFIFYLIFSAVCYKLCKELCQGLKHKTLIQNILLAVLILNPLILGYFHTLLTEFIAITFTVLNILLAYKWLSCNLHSKKQIVLYALYFFFSVIFCYQLKQPYIIIAFIPFLIAAIISIVQKHTRFNIIYRLSTILLSIVFLFVSIFSWNKILVNMGVDMNTGRDSSSALSRQLLQAYQITYDQDKDGIVDSLSVTDTIGVLFNDFISNPLHITTVYLSNYCGLISVCIIETNDLVNYISTFNLAGINTFENSIIGYRPYSDSSNLFDSMPEHLHDRATQYGESSHRGIIAFAMNIFRIPTNLLFKLSLIFCLPTLIFLIVVKIKTKNRNRTQLFYLNLILLGTSFAHIAISAGIGLIIDRYAIEAFIPSILGIFGTIVYTKSVFTKITAPSSLAKKSKKLQKNA